MISLFSRTMDRAVDLQFRKDPGGRLVFLPFGPRKKAYFVDSKSDEEKIRAFVKMYRSFFCTDFHCDISKRLCSRFDPGWLRWLESTATQIGDCSRGPCTFLVGPCRAGNHALGRLQVLSGSEMRQGW